MKPTLFSRVCIVALLSALLVQVATVRADDPADARRREQEAEARRQQEETRRRNEEQQRQQEELQRRMNEQRQADLQRQQDETRRRNEEEQQAARQRAEAEQARVDEQRRQQEAAAAQQLAAEARRRQQEAVEAQRRHVEALAQQHAAEAQRQQREAAALQQAAETQRRERDVAAQQQASEAERRQEQAAAQQNHAVPPADAHAASKGWPVDVRQQPSAASDRPKTVVAHISTSRVKTPARWLQPGFGAAAFLLASIPLVYLLVRRPHFWRITGPRLGQPVINPPRAPRPHGGATAANTVTIKRRCITCGKRVGVIGGRAGKRFRCPGCSTVQTITK
jgi:hypothetical protein